MMPVNDGAFKRELAELRDEVSEGISRFVREIALDVYSRITIRTPVDTGRARGNWFLSVGRRSTRKSEKRGFPSPGESMAAASAELAQVQAFETIYITNNLPYINRLEGGSSTQRPNGWVAITIAEFDSGLHNR